jgi:hypothetical protein
LKSKKKSDDYPCRRFQEAIAKNRHSRYFILKNTLRRIRAWRRRVAT